MTDLDVVYLAVASAGRPISATEIAFTAEMERDAVSRALHGLSKAGRVKRDEARNPNAGRASHKSTMFVYTPADAPTGDDASPVAEPVGEDLSPTPTEPKPSKAQREADGWIDEAIKAAALRPVHRWLVTPMGRTLDTREAALDEATRLAMSEGEAFAVCRVEAVASVKVEIEWEA